MGVNPDYFCRMAPGSLHAILLTNVAINFLILFRTSVLHVLYILSKSFQFQFKFKRDFDSSPKELTFYRIRRRCILTSTSFIRAFLMFPQIN